MEACIKYWDTLYLKHILKTDVDEIEIDSIT